MTPPKDIQYSLRCKDIVNSRYKKKSVIKC